MLCFRRQFFLLPFLSPSCSLVVHLWETSALTSLPSCPFSAHSYSLVVHRCRPSTPTSLSWGQTLYLAIFFFFSTSMQSITHISHSTKIPINSIIFSGCAKPSSPTLFLKNIFFLFRSLLICGLCIVADHPCPATIGDNFPFPFSIARWLCFSADHPLSTNPRRQISFFSALTDCALLKPSTPTLPFKYNSLPFPLSVACWFCSSADHSLPCYLSLDNAIPLPLSGCALEQTIHFLPTVPILDNSSFSALCCSLFANFCRPSTSATLEDNFVSFPLSIAH